MSLQEKLTEARQQVADLCAKGHSAVLEEIYMEKKLIGVTIHHYEMCSQCVKEREEASGKERKV